MDSVPMGKRLTPLEIFDYKRHWMAEGFRVTLHSDKRWDATKWCKKNVPTHQWDIQWFTDVYEDTFFFETLEDSNTFMKEFKR